VSFLFQLTPEQLEKVEKRLKKGKIPYNSSLCGGYFPQDGAKVFVDYGVGETQWSPHPTENYFGTVDYMNCSEDGVFWELDKDKKRKRVKNVNEVFKMMTLEEWEAKK